MLEAKNIRNEIESKLKNQDADYIEVRLEQTNITRLTYRGPILEEVIRTATLGGNVRALKNGGWGFVSFNDIDNIKDKILLAIKQADITGNRKLSLVKIEPVIDTVPADIKKDPTKIPLIQKKRLMDEYNDIILRTPGIKTSTIGYADSRRKVIFFSSEGSAIEQEFIDVTLRINAIASQNGEVQQLGISIGSRGDFSVVENLYSSVRDLAERTVKLLTASKIKGGEYSVILDPVLAGVFVHEAFGHLSESDHVYENQNLKEMMVLGRKFGGKNLNIVDGAAIPGLRGSYKYDDEGVPAHKTYLIREGILEGRLHSRETASIMGEKITGNARAISYAYAPIVRMTNTYIEPGNVSFEDMIGDIKEGIYAKNWYGGTTSLEMFTFSAGEAYMIRNGKIAEMLQPVVLSGNVFTTLKNIAAIGNDLDMNQGGGCGKADQSPLPVSNGSPHILIHKCLVGGR